MNSIEAAMLLCVIFLSIGVWAGRIGQMPSARQREFEAYQLDCMRLINELREPEGWMLNLYCDNPDFDNGPNVTIDLFGDWPEGWVERKFTGTLLLECLANAKHERDLLWQGCLIKRV